MSIEELVAAAQKSNVQPENVQVKDEKRNFGPLGPMIDPAHGLHAPSRKTMP